MSNIWIICRKELKSYFSSPIAYGLMVFFAFIAGYFFYAATAIFVSRSVESQMMGRSMPMDLNEWIIRPVLMNVSVIGLFLIPMITMRVFAEEKRSGTMELLVTSPVRDLEIILGKWLGALIMYACILGISFLNILILFAYGTPDWRPLLVGYFGLLLQGGCLLAIGTFISTTTRNQIIAGVGTFAICLLLWVLHGYRLRDRNCRQGHFLSFGGSALRSPSQRVCSIPRTSFSICRSSSSGCFSPPG